MRRESNTERYSAVYPVDKHRVRSFSVRTSVEEALEDLKNKAMDGQAMRFVKTDRLIIGAEVTPTIASGCAVRLWIDTSATEDHLTKEKHESYGRLVSELYQGPFSRPHCHQIIAELKGKVPYLGVINLHICASRASLEQMIEDWHEGLTDAAEAFSQYATSPGSCVFLGDGSEG